MIRQRYRVGRKLGEGGFGAVYHATHLEMDSDVALKVMHVDRASPEMAGRFALEAKRSAALRHPNTISVFDFGTTEDGELYLAMELLEGRPLGQLLADEGPLPGARARHILAQILMGLGAAHARGLVHRDLKPDNVFLVQVGDDHDFVKVLDFGIAKAIDSDTQLTASGMLIGTPAYMSPEQCRGLPVDARSDLYSLGCLAFFMLAGRLPLTSENTLGYILAHVQQAPPDLHEVSGGAVSKELSRWVARLLEKSPERRFRSADEARRALDAAAGEAPNGAYETGTLRRDARVVPPRPWWWLVGAAGVVTIAIIAALVAANGDVEVSAKVAEGVPVDAARTLVATVEPTVADTSAPTPPTAPPVEVVVAPEVLAAVEVTAPSTAAREVMLESVPSGAKVWVDGVAVGVTPYPLKLGASLPVVKLVLPGYTSARVVLGDGARSLTTLRRVVKPIQPVAPADDFERVE